MSGTSLDGVDAAYVEILPRGEGYALELVRFLTLPFEPELHEALLAALPPHAGTVAAAARLHNALGHAYARAARAAALGDPVDFIGSHGQTLWHEGSRHLTFQLGDAFVIREAMSATVCYDFRSADTAAGGQGAPLVARIDALLLGSAFEDRVALNLGGIANVTILRAGARPADAIAFDTGPANMLIDAFVRERSGGAQHFDEDGVLAAAGCVDANLLDAMLADDFFAMPPPKSTGRERFGSQFLFAHEGALRRLSLEDGAATLTELTARSVAEAIERLGYRHAHVIVSGGGARNETLVRRIAARLAGARVERSDSMDIPAHAKEAMAFALLGYETLRGRASNVPGATGAARPVCLGAIAPHDLSSLLGRVARECTP